MAERKLEQRLNLFDATMIVAGSMIGSGIFIVSADIARTVGSPAGLLAVWLLTGVLTVVGALCYGELAVMMPHAGGQYVFLREAYNPLCGFLYGWTMFLVIQTGTIAAVAVAFARFLGVLVPWASESNTLLVLPLGSATLTIAAAQLVAIAVIALLTAVNCFGLTAGKLLQNVFTVAKVGTLVALILVGFLWGRSAEALAANREHFWGSAPLTMALIMAAGGAMVGSLFSADAWNSVTFAAAEVRNPKRNLPLALALGAGMVCVLYFLVNGVYLFGLPLEGTKDAATIQGRGIQYATTDRVATALIESIVGSAGASIMAGAIMVSTFGCVNGLILSGARVYYAMARDRLFFETAGELNNRHVPAFALILQGCWASVLTLSGTYSELLDYVIFAALLFYVLTVAGLFRLRRRLPDAERSYRAMGYPIVPAMYVLVSALIMIDLLFVRPKYTWPGLLIVLTGVPVFYFWNRRNMPAP